MTEKLHHLTTADLRTVAAAIRASRLPAPFSAVGLQRLVAGESSELAAEGLQALTASGFNPEQIATVLELLANDRDQRNGQQDFVEIVTSGPETDGAANRDTAVVVRELFAHAKKSVFAAGFAVHQGRRVFEVLGERMSTVPALNVRLVLDIQRGKDTSLAADLVERFSRRFVTYEWPSDRPLPQVYYDPRSLALPQRACMHAKCVVMDRQHVFVTSANFTEAAQERNVEVGLLMDSAHVATHVLRYFDGLIESGNFKPWLWGAIE